MSRKIFLKNFLNKSCRVLSDALNSINMILGCVATVR